MQEEDAFSRLLLLQAVQRQVHTEIWGETKHRGDHEAVLKAAEPQSSAWTRGSVLIKGQLSSCVSLLQAAFCLPRKAGAPVPLAFRQYFTVKLENTHRHSAAASPRREEGVGVR